MIEVGGWKGIGLNPLYAQNCSVFGGRISASLFVSIVPYTLGEENYIDTILDVFPVQKGFYFSSWKQGSGSYLWYFSNTLKSVDVSGTKVNSQYPFFFGGHPGDFRCYAFSYDKEYYIAKTNATQIVKGSQGRIVNIFPLRNIGIANFEGDVLWRSDWDVPYDFSTGAQATLGAPTHAVVTDGFDPYIVTPYGSFWINFGAGESVIQNGFFPPLINAMVEDSPYTYVNLHVARNYSAYIDSTGYIVFMVGRGAKRTEFSIFDVLEQVNFGDAGKAYIYFNAYFPFWFVLVSKNKLFRESDANWSGYNTIPTKSAIIEELVSDESDVKSVIIWGAFDGIYGVYTLTDDLIGTPCAFSYGIIFGYGNKVVILPFRNVSFVSDFLWGAPSVIPKSYFCLPPDARIVGLRIKRIIIEGDAVEYGNYRVHFSKQPYNPTFRSFAFLGGTGYNRTRSAENHHKGDNYVVIPAGFVYNGEHITFEVVNANRWSIRRIIFDIEQPKGGYGYGGTDFSR